MNFLNGMKNRPWLMITLILVVGVIIGIGAGPLIMNAFSLDTTQAAVQPSEPVSAEPEPVTVQPVEPVSAEPEPVAAAQEAEAQQVPDPTVESASVSTVDDPPQTVALTVDQSQIDFDDLGTYQGMPAGFTEEGFPYLGEPSAPVTLEEYSDFLCPFCGRHFIQTLPTLIEQYVSQGQVKYVFRDMPLVGLHPTAPQGHVAARCVAEQGAAYFWLMHDELFKRQNDWSRLPDPTGYLTGLAAAMGVDMEAFQACLDAGEKQPLVEASVAAGGALGFNGTPSFQFIQHENNDEIYSLVGAYPVETFSQWLDALIAGEAPPQEEEPEPPELPFWANSEGLAPDPERPGHTMAGDPYKGNPEAALVVVEFADFQCDSCQRHALETQPTVDEQFVETGQIMWVFKPLPLKEHPYAPAAAVAAECAADQGQFWEMHHLLFETQAEWSTATDPEAGLLDLAGQLDLDLAAFETCFNSRPALERVLSDMYDAQGVIQTTPTFIFLYEGRGSVTRGTRPAEEFVSLLQKQLEAAHAAGQEQLQ